MYHSEHYRLQEVRIKGQLPTGKGDFQSDILY